MSPHLTSNIHANQCWVDFFSTQHKMDKSWCHHHVHHVLSVLHLYIHTLLLCFRASLISYSYRLYTGIKSTKLVLSKPSPMSCSQVTSHAITNTQYSWGITHVNSDFLWNRTRNPVTCKFDATTDYNSMGPRAPVVVASNLVRTNTPPTDQADNAWTNLWFTNWYTVNVA